MTPLGIKRRQHRWRRKFYSLQYWQVEARTSVAFMGNIEIPHVPTWFCANFTSEDRHWWLRGNASGNQCARQYELDEQSSANRVKLQHCPYFSRHRHLSVALPRCLTVSLRLIQERSLSSHLSTSHLYKVSLILCISLRIVLKATF